MPDNTIIINARGKSFGRLASEVSIMLQGKRNPAYRRNVISGPKIRVENLNAIKFDKKKFSRKLYRKHTGYIGHLKEETFERLWAKKPVEVFKKTISGMLPKNKLRSRWLKRLEVIY